jgi:Uri superfamily endonuclease
MKGSYIIIVYLPINSAIRVGALGTLDFVKGYYLYIGSAMGNKGSTTLENRIKRHISNPKNKTIFWHIDYLLANKKCVITCVYLIPTLSRLECLISGELSKISDNLVRGFGSSDCKCLSHLYYFKEFWDLEQIGKPP